MDQFENRSPGLESPASGGAALSPDDNADLAQVTRALWVGTSGDVSVVLKSGDAVTFKNATGWMPMRVARLMATGTSATGIVGVW